MQLWCWRINQRREGRGSRRGLFAAFHFAEPSFQPAGLGERAIRAPLLSINSLMRLCTEPENAQNQHHEDSNIKQCMNHGSLH